MSSLINEYEVKEKMKGEDMLEEAQKLYDKGKWDKAVKLLEANESLLIRISPSELYRLLGWCYYYLGIKGPESEKSGQLGKAIESWYKCIISSVKPKKEAEISAMNGLPLALWILKRREEAWKVSDEAVEKFSEVPSVWNTRSILCRWEKDHQRSIDVCEKVYKTALQKGDYRTAGHGKHNKADALVKLGRRQDAIEEYEEAKKLYQRYEEVTGESAKFHIEGVEKKLADL